jgi:hypothetical protein
MAAKEIGWEYGDLLKCMLGCSRSLAELRGITPGSVWD